MEEKQSPTYKQKIQFLKGEMPEWRQMKMGRQFRAWQTDNFKAVLAVIRTSISLQLNVTDMMPYPIAYLMAATVHKR